VTTTQMGFIGVLFLFIVGAAIVFRFVNAPTSYEFSQPTPYEVALSDSEHIRPDLIILGGSQREPNHSYEVEGRYVTYLQEYRLGMIDTGQFITNVQELLTKSIFLGGGSTQWSIWEVSVDFYSTYRIFVQPTLDFERTVIFSIATRDGYNEVRKTIVEGDIMYIDILPNGFEVSRNGLEPLFLSRGELLW